jgi:hypothetical protein
MDFGSFHEFRIHWFNFNYFNSGHSNDHHGNIILLMVISFIHSFTVSSSHFLRLLSFCVQATFPLRNKHCSLVFIAHNLCRKVQSGIERRYLDQLQLHYHHYLLTMAAHHSDQTKLVLAITFFAFPLSFLHTRYAHVRIPKKRKNACANSINQSKSDLHGSRWPIRSSEFGIRWFSCKKVVKEVEVFLILFLCLWFMRLFVIPHTP